MESRKKNRIREKKMGSGKKNGSGSGKTGSGSRLPTSPKTLGQIPCPSPNFGTKIPPFPPKPWDKSLPNPRPVAGIPGIPTLDPDVGGGGHGEDEEEEDEDEGLQVVGRDPLHPEQDRPEQLSLEKGALSAQPAIPEPWNSVPREFPAHLGGVEAGAEGVGQAPVIHGWGGGNPG